MALAFYFSPSAGMSARQYDECITQLKKAGAGHPPGRSYHACFGTADRVMVFDVWTSQAAFDKFGKTLMPILQGIGVDPGQPDVMAVHNVIVRSAAKRAAPKSTRQTKAGQKAKPSQKSGRGKKR